MNKNNRSGFTLLEIIIVIIIVGVLASLALPRFFATVEFSKGTEGLNAMASIRGSIERCYLMTAGTYVGCDAFATLDLDDPSGSPGNHFTYAITAVGTTGYTIVAERNSYDGDSADGDTISLTQDLTGVTRAGSGAYGGIQ